MTAYLLLQSEECYLPRDYTLIKVVLKKARGKISHVRYTSGGGNDDVMLYYLDEQINMMHMLM